MKTSSLFTAIAAAASIGAASSALAWDFDRGPQFKFGGTANEYFHLLNIKADPDVCLNNCITIGGAGLESQVVLKSYASSPVATDHSNRTIGCTDTSNTGAYDSLDSFAGRTFLPQTGTNLAAGTSDYSACAVDIAADGRIAAGWQRSSQNQFGIQFDTDTDYDRQVLVVLSSCTAAPILTEVRTIMDAWLGGADEAALGAIPLSNGCGLDGVGQAIYAECDTDLECGQFSKSVPVPAFAAAALGLGLLGITYISGRRRTIS